MKTVSANEAKQSLGRVIDDAQREPVLIKKHNRPVVVVMSVHDYDKLRGLKVAEFSAFCDRVGEKAKRKGLTEEELDKLLSEA